MSRVAPLVLTLGLLVLLVWLILIWQPTPDLSAHHRQLGVEDAPGGGDFVLYSPRGPVDLHDLRGRVVLLYFGYTWCPDICPTNLAAQGIALSQLSADELANVQSLFVSVDPERDDLDRLREYTAYFHPSILGVTGTAEEVAYAAGLYGAAYRRVEQDSALGYAMDHSASTYLIDQRGRLTRIFQHGTSPDELRRGIQGLLEDD